MAQIMNSLLPNSDLKKVGKTTRPFKYDLNQTPYIYSGVWDIVEVRSKFKGLDLINRVPDELWTEVHDIVQETEIKTIPKKKKCKKAKCQKRPYKWLRKEEKWKAKEKRKDISIWIQSSKEQQGEIRKPCSMISAKKQRDTIEWERLEISSRKLKDTKGTLHTKMGSVKDRNGMDLTEAEDIKKRWQEYTELYKKDLHDPDSHDNVITHLKPDKTSPS